MLAAPLPAHGSWTPIGKAHGDIAKAALGNPQSATFIAYLGLKPDAIADYAQGHEPWDGDWKTHTAFWSIIKPDGQGKRYTNDLGYVGLSHNRDGGSWPGSFDRSVDVIGAVLHSAGDCAVIMGHSPANDWYSNQGYEAVFEHGGDNVSGTAWTAPDLPFIAGDWPRYVYDGVAVNEAHRLYLDTHASFVWWDQNLSELQKTFGGGKLDSAAEKAVKSGKRWTEAVLLDFLRNWVRREPSVAIACNEVAGSPITVNTGSPLSFHYVADGDRHCRRGDSARRERSRGPGAERRHRTGAHRLGRPASGQHRGHARLLRPRQDRLGRGGHCGGRGTEGDPADRC
ncbi:MAG: hypothetical protein HY744_33890 [Deltaproteobacteria bacterium]|nr:hypothetical protein [Deltaproteobacteria bacterium]